MEDCDICLKRVTRRARVISTPCGHSAFHAQCLAQWMKVSPTCPLCKASLEDFALQCATEDTGRITRAKRRACMEAGIGKLSQFEEDMLLATELSVLPSHNH